MWPTAGLISSWALPAPATADVPPVTRAAASDQGTEQRIVLKGALNIHRQRRDGKPKWSVQLGE